MRSGKKGVGQDNSPAEPSRTPDTLLQLVHDHNLGRVDSLNHELGYSIPLLDLKVHLGMVEQKHLDLSSVVRVDDPCPCIYEVLNR